MRGICPHCGKEFDVFCVLKIEEPKKDPYSSTKKIILWELEKRKTGCLTLKTLAKRCGFTRANVSEFRKPLNQLVQKGLVEIHRSGYRSDSKAHSLVACLRQDPTALALLVKGGS